MRDRGSLEQKHRYAGNIDDLFRGRARVYSTAFDLVPGYREHMVMESLVHGVLHLSEVFQAIRITVWAAFRASKTHRYSVGGQGEIVKTTQRSYVDRTVLDRGMKIMELAFANSDIDASISSEGSCLYEKYGV